MRQSLLNGLVTAFGAVVTQRAPVASLDDRKHPRRTDVARRTRDRRTLRHFVIADATSTAGEASTVGNTGHTPLRPLGHSVCCYRHNLVPRLSGS